MADSTVPSRFSNWSLIEGFSCFATRDNSLRSFFNGDDVSKRMSLIRQAITTIRTKWDEYPTFMKELEQSFLRNSSSSDSALSHGTLTQIRKEWADRSPPQCATTAPALQRHEEYAFIRLYTSADGYRQFFSILNDAFRTDTLSDQQLHLRAAVFLVELLTIELFNYVYHSVPDPRTHTGFTGVVYRGMRLSDEHVGDFERLMMRPVRERYWSIPLALMSCTVDREKALEFAKSQPPSADRRHPVLLSVHVACLPPSLLSLYQSKFPSIFVSTVCAVNISSLSDFPDEQEVLLRGPFFQLVNVREEQQSDGTGLVLLEAVMFNTARDHPSTMEMDDEEGERARGLFACLISIARAEECARWAEIYGMPEDVQAYKGIKEEGKKRLEVLLKGV